MSIDALAHELIELQQTAKRLLESGDLDGWLDAIAAECRVADRLHYYLLHNSAVVTDDPAVRELLAGIDLTELNDPDKIGMDLLLGSISPAEYAANLALVDVLIAPFQIPFNLRQFLSEARKCYAIGHHAAVQSLSRTILEVAVNDIAVRTGKIPIEAIEQNKFTTKCRIQKVAGTHCEPIYQHYRALCTVVHGLRTSSADGPLVSLTKTIGYVQHLYELNKGEG